MKSAAVLLIPREKCRMCFSIGIFDAAALFPPYGGRSVFVFINFRPFMGSIDTKSAQSYGIFLNCTNFE